VNVDAALACVTTVWTVSCPLARDGNPPVPAVRSGCR
jgi:hypothetical protein